MQTEATPDRVRTPRGGRSQEEIRRIEALHAEYHRHPTREARNALVEEYLDLAVTLARRFARRGEPTDDLNQVACLAMVKAVERFDPDRGYPFKAFAVPTVMGELRRHFRDHGWTVRVPRRLQELRLDLDGVSGRLRHELRRAPTVAELAAATGATEAEVRDAEEAGNRYRPNSLDAPVQAPEGPPSTLGEQMGRDDADLAAVEDRVRVRRLLSRLPERERRIVFLRYFDDMTQSAIAEEMGISQMHVSRLLARSLAVLGEEAVGAPGAGGSRRPAVRRTHPARGACTRRTGTDRHAC